MDYEKYRDIAPYRGEDYDAAVKRLKDNIGLLRMFVETLLGTDDPEKIDKFFNYIVNNLDNAKNYDEFMHGVTAGVLVPTVMKKTMADFTTSGMEKLEKGKGYLFIGNHRDIVLDCAILDYALLAKDLPFCEMAFGDNLIINQFVEDLFRLNGGVVIRRNLQMRAKYLETLRISSYFNEVIKEENRSVWIAQKSGRSKNGIDETAPSIIKMFHLSQKSLGKTFSETMNSLNIVPIAISYENDPNDINKAREEVAKATKGKYEKRKLEDAISMVKGMREWKGRVHLAFCEPVKGEFESPEEVAALIDKEIHTGYKLWPNSMFCYDYLEKSDRFKEETKDFDGEEFLSHYAHLSEDVRNFVLNSYANPVRSYIKDNG